MYKTTKLDAVISSNGVGYFVTTGDIDSERSYGIYCVMENDSNDCNSAENLFFTKEEAIECCKWLSENNVFPVTLCEVLNDTYHL